MKNRDRILFSFRPPNFADGLKARNANWFDGIRSEAISESSYSALFRYVCKTRQQRQIYVEQLVESARPALGYIYLAGLIANGTINTVVTTNFDDLLADTLLRFYNIKPIVCAFDSAITSFNAASSRPKIIKLHGDFLFDNIKTTDADTLDLTANMEEKLVEVCADKGIIFVGYSGGDESVMAPMRENLRRNRKFCSKGVHWCITTTTQNGVPPQAGAVSRNVQLLRQRYPGMVHLYTTRGFDDLMYEMFAACGAALPEGILDPSSTSLGHAFQSACDSLENYQPLSDEMRAHRRLAVESFGAEMDRRPIRLEEANDLFERGKSLERTDPEAAAHLHLAAVEIAEQVRKDSKVQEGAYWAAVRRISGSQISLAQLPGFDAELLLREARQEVVSFITGRSNIVDGLPPLFARAIYNASCANGRLYGLGVTDKADLATTACALIDIMRRSASSRLHVKKLLSDADMKAMVDASELDDYLER